jgi:hypothetical protein
MEPDRMRAMVGARAFLLAAARAGGGVYCGADGAFVDGVPLLQRADTAGAWSVRSTAALNDELSARYRLPIDIAPKTNALALIAHALNRGDVAMAAIAAVQMQLPDPPLADAPEDHGQTVQRAAELNRVGLLKFWDPLKHPRIGTPPNPGWFAATDGADQDTPSIQIAPRTQLAMAPEEKRPRDTFDFPTGGGRGGGGGSPFGPGGVFGPPADYTGGPNVIRPSFDEAPFAAEKLPAPPAEVAPAARESAVPPRLGAFPVPDDLTFGTTPFGNYAHGKIANLLKEKYPDVSFIFKVLPGQKGVDVEVLQKFVPQVGGNFFEIKPLSPAGEAAFRRQVRRWELEGVRPLTYDAHGNVYYGFRR